MSHWEKAAECARAIERSTDPDEDPDFRPIQLGLPVEDESRPAVNRAAQFISYSCCMPCWFIQVRYCVIS